jgi:catechol 2,3-dioxygenase-like lactoylglutathione lyase family enzyme
MSGQDAARAQSPSAYGLEVVTLPTRDVDVAIGFYTEMLGFTLDVDYQPAPDFRVVQLTPPGSATSIQLGVGLTDAEPGSVRASYLVVADLAATYRLLTGRGVPVRDLRHKAPVGDWRGGFEPGLDPDRADYASFADLSDPDGNGWVLQERGFSTAH